MDSIRSKDTVADLVHPNASGAAKMTRRWFDALVTVMEKPPVVYQPEILPYKPTAKGDLTLHVFRPEGTFTTPRPAIVFFFGGGWQRGTPLQFYPECQCARCQGHGRHQRGLPHGVQPRNHRVRSRGRREIRHPLDPFARGGARNRS